MHAHPSPRDHHGPEAAEVSPGQPSGHRILTRQVGVVGAVLLGLGSMVGTGIFVSTGIAAGVVGPAILLAIVVAALVAACNGLSSAQLAAAYPVAGGTYEYGYRCLNPAWGFTAGWMFLCAKSASAATAALGVAAAILQLIDAADAVWMVPVAAGAVIAITALVLTGVRRSNQVNAAIVLITLAALGSFVVSLCSQAVAAAGENLTPFFFGDSPGQQLARFAEACALMFVAYTGYGRVATLGEEIREPQKNIPRAVIVTLATTMLLYLAVTFTAVAAIGAAEFAQAGGKPAAPLQVAAARSSQPWVPQVIAVGAITAMLGVLLNLVLGLSRIVLAMGRRGDLPELFASVSERGTSPTPAVVFVGILIAGLTLLGDIKMAWSFSAFTVLLYYAITNLAAIRMPKDLRRYPALIPWLGLLGCLSLAFWVEARIWLAGLGLVALGLLWHLWRRRRKQPEIR